MHRHQITTASLLQAIDDQRADEASSRWDEISREFMSDDAGDEAHPDEDIALVPEPGSRPESV
jgi:hypothetical protein